MEINMLERATEKKFRFKNLWAQEQFVKLRREIGEELMSDKEIKEYLVEKISENYKDLKGRFFNNIDKTNEEMTVSQFLGEFLNHEYILTGYDCLYKDQNHAMNIGSMALESLLSSRKKFKKKMEASDYGSDDYIYYKVLQLTFKVLANSYYGILGEQNSIFYNPFVQNSITLSGQTLITTSIVTMESFLDNNFKFRNLDDFYTYKNNILDEKKGERLNILNFLDQPKNLDEVYTYFRKKLPEGIDEELLMNSLKNLSLEELNDLYWKNNTREILFHSWFNDKLRKLFQYEYTTELNEAVKDDMEELKMAILEFCFYNHIFYDEYIKASEDTRDVVCTIDTDSNFININGLVTDFLKREKIEKTNDVQTMTIVNIFINIVTKALEETFWHLTGNFGIPEEIRPRINMKNEFIYSRLMLTRNKKSYGGIITSELGRILTKPQLDIKGLSIRKTTVPKKLRKKFTDLLTDDILKVEKLDLKRILDRFDEIEAEVEESLRNGLLEFSLPKNIELIDNYAEPSRIEPVRGMLIWNKLEPQNQIVPPEKVNMIKLNASFPDCPAMEKLKQTHPDKWKIILDTCFSSPKEGSKETDISKFGFTCISIPKSVEVIPDYLKDFIDYDLMVNMNISNGLILLESLGIYTAEDVSAKSKYKSNIIEI